ncbi:polysaccharide deacetylase family protein [Salipaludibacillus neizhouensis]|uniref:polysaccharide deacetylase family protein n=1 Tax=Salipaludibacillus neizhouensis TaxID=885475 RepID=UPI001CBA6263|nr:polysaccharide deacetylase family protein [Salipaludibacillus neizhouensis]
MYNFNDERAITTAKNRSNKKEKIVHLTFDDGPSKYLEDILDVLAAEGVVAHFFWQSRLLHHQRPWKRVLAEGHMIGSHSHSHPDLTKLTYEEQKKQLVTSKKIIEEVTKQPVHYFRPPFGQYNSDTLDIASNLEMETILWNVASLDWTLKDDPEKIIQNVNDYVLDGSIVLLHEVEQTLYVLPRLIKTLKKKGFTFSTIRASMN